MTLQQFEQFEKVRKQVEKQKKKQWEKRATKILNQWIETFIDESDTQPTNQ
jgi:hypothetical protein